MMIAYNTKIYSVAKCVALLSFIYLIFFESTSALTWRSDYLETVDIKPGAGLQNIEAKANWEFDVSKSYPAGSWRCGLGRPSASYLFFEEFALELSSGHLQSAYLESRPGTHLPDNEFIFDPIQKTVRHNPGKFKSQLNFIEVEFTDEPLNARDL